MLEFTPLDTDPKSMNEAVHQNSLAMNDCAIRLGDLARAFQATGNSVVATTLYEICRTLDERQEILSVTWGKHVGDMLRESEQASTNMLNAALAGLAIGSRRA